MTNRSPASVAVVAAVVLMAFTLAVHTGGVDARLPGVPAKWVAFLNASTSGSDNNVLSGNGYSFSTGDTLLLTDVNGTLYAIDVQTGQVLWAFNTWPAIPASVAQARQIAGNDATVVVLRSTDLWAFATRTGQLRSHVTLGPSFVGPGNAASINMIATLLQVSNAQVVEMRSVSSLEIVFSYNSTALMGIVTCASNGNGDVVDVALLEGSAIGLALLYYRKAAPPASKFSLLYNVSVPGMNTPSSWAYLLQCSSARGDVIYFDASTYVALMRYNPSQPGNAGLVYSVEPSPRRNSMPQGFGFGASDTLFFHYSNHVSVMNHASGTVLGHSHQFTDVSFIDHILVYTNASSSSSSTLLTKANASSAFALVGMTMNDGSFNISAWSVPGPSDAGVMPLAWTRRMGASVANTTRTTLGIMEGSFAPLPEAAKRQQLLVPTAEAPGGLPSGFELLSVQNGRTVLQIDGGDLVNYDWKSSQWTKDGDLIFAAGRDVFRVTVHG